MELKKRLEGVTRGRRPPARLYHYTTAEGLQGIVSSRTVWATNAAYVNDSSELTHGYRIVKAWLEAKASGSTGIARSLAEQTLSNMDAGRGIADVHLFCLTENRDQLSQWRAYAGMGAGYALAFDSASVLSHQTRLTTPGIAGYVGSADGPPRIEHLLPVVYELDEQHQMIEAQFEIALEDLSGRGEVSGFLGPLAQTSLLLSLALVDDVLMFKNPAFKEEAEWRGVFIRFDGMSRIPLGFRSRGGLLVPYVALSLAGEGHSAAPPIVEVVRGPQIDAELAERSLRSFLRQSGYPPEIVTRSAIPLR